jgi:hypothetical protein
MLSLIESHFIVATVLCPEVSGRTVLKATKKLSITLGIQTPGIFAAKHFRRCYGFL